MSASVLLCPAMPRLYTVLSLRSVLKIYKYTNDLPLCCCPSSSPLYLPPTQPLRLLWLRTTTPRLNNSYLFHSPAVVVDSGANLYRGLETSTRLPVYPPTHPPTMAATPSMVCYRFLWLFPMLTYHLSAVAAPSDLPLDPRPRPPCLPSCIESLPFLQLLSCLCSSKILPTC